MADKLGISTGKGFIDNIAFVTSSEPSIGSIIVAKTKSIIGTTVEASKKLHDTFTSLYIPASQSGNLDYAHPMWAYVSESELLDDYASVGYILGGTWTLCGMIKHASNEYYMILQKVAN